MEGVLEVVSKRKREAGVLREILRDADLNREVRLFLEEVVSGHPNQDICILVAHGAGRIQRRDVKSLTALGGSYSKSTLPRSREGSP